MQEYLYTQNGRPCRIVCGTSDAPWGEPRVIVEFYDGPQATVLESDLVCLSQYREAYRQGWLDVSAGIKVTDWTWNPSPAYIMGYRAGRSDWYAGGAWYEAIKERCH